MSHHLTEFALAALLFLAPVQRAEVTAYDVNCRGCSGITASGRIPRVGRTIACPPELRFGTRVWIPGAGLRTCEDRGGAIKGRTFDLFVGSRAEALRWGRRRVLVIVLEEQ